MITILKYNQFNCSKLGLSDQAELSTIKLIILKYSNHQLSS